MQVSYSHDLIAISIQEDAKTFYFLQNLINKNFSKKIGKKAKTIIFKQDNEKVQRRYFLKLISKIYKRKNINVKKAELEKIKNSYNKSIKLTLLKTNQILQNIKINMSIDDNYVVLFKFETNNSILITYIKNYFKNHLISYRNRSKIMTIYPNSSKTTELIDNLLVQKELLGSYIEFEYNQHQYEQYKVILNEKRKRKNRYFALFSLLEDYYNVLGCTKNDSFGVIRAKYLELVKQYHPDRLNSSNNYLATRCRKKFHDIQYAYEMIKTHYTYEKKHLTVA